MQPRVVGEKSFNRSGLVDRGAVPQEDDGTSQMPKQVFKEAMNLGGRDVVGMESKVEEHAMPFGRDGQGRDGRQLGPAAGGPKDGRLSFGGPGSADAGDEQEARFIEEDQMGPTSVSVFLYGAIGTVSSEQSRLRPAPEPGFGASDNSTPGQPGAARCGWDDTGRQSVGR